MTCKQCNNFEDCKDDAFVNGAKFDPNESVEYCTGFEPITNADRIRAMSDEGIAQWLCLHYGCTKCPGEGLCTINDGKHNGLTKWLQQPVGED